VLLGAVGLFGLTAASAQLPVSAVSPAALLRVSQAVSAHYYLSHPAQAPEPLRARLAPAVAKASKKHVLGHKHSTAFNADDLGLPQNEESITDCRPNSRYALGGTNDYRGLLDPDGNFTGWHFSTDGGGSLFKEGLLPKLTISGVDVPSGGDPVDVSDWGCNFYAGSLNYTLLPDLFQEPNGIGVYKSDAATLTSCDVGSDPASCWPVRRIVAQSPNPPGGAPITDYHFYDKEWLDVGTSGGAGKVLWITFSDFHFTGPGTDTLDYTASIKAVRCTADLVTCTPPILISGSDEDVQFSDVTIGSDGKTYITWAEIIGELPGSGGEPSQPQRFVIKSRLADAGSTTFGPTHVVATIEKPVPFNGLLHANDFRIASYPKSTVLPLGSSTVRWFATWEECSARPLDTICEEPVVKLSYSDDAGATWSTPTVISRGGDNYFPTISADPTTGLVAVAWYTNRFDQTFHNAQDVELATIQGSTADVRRVQRLTRTSNETEADPILGGAFIGDYFEVFAYNRTAWVHFNANYRSELLLDGLLGEGVPVPQQDNFLTRTGL
jgi:hypothetical protein